MSKIILLASLLLIATSSHAEESWFDSALEFLGLGGDEKEAVEAKAEEKPKLDLEAMKATAAKVAADTGVTEMASNAATSGLTEMVTNQLGVTNKQAMGGLGSLFGVAKNSLGSDEFRQLSGAVPEMDTLLAAAPVLSENAKGLTSLLGSAGKYGNALQGATQAYSQFKQLGIGVDKIPGYINVTDEFLKSQGSGDTATLFQKGVAAVLSGDE